MLTSQALVICFISTITTLLPISPYDGRYFSEGFSYTYTLYKCTGPEPNPKECVETDNEVAEIHYRDGRLAGIRLTPSLFVLAIYNTDQSGGITFASKDLRLVSPQQQNLLWAQYEFVDERWPGENELRIALKKNDDGSIHLIFFEILQIYDEMPRKVHCRLLLIPKEEH